MTELKHRIPSVSKDGAESYGGNQQWLEQAYMRKSACGVIACVDLLLYLHRYRPGCRTEQFREDPGEGAVDLELYRKWVRAIQTRYLPVIPYVGTIGGELALALNRYFKKYAIPLHASWSVKKGMLWKSIEAMLTNDLPVILAVGNNFPIPLHRHKLDFYKAGRDAPAARTTAHFVTVTGMDEKRLRISSWGREYYIDRQEFWEYARRHSGFYTSNILWIWYR